MAIDKIITVLKDSIKTKEEILNNPALLQMIDEATTSCIKCLKADGKLLFCGNGGSAADAQHLAAEFSGRFYHDRDPLFAEALHVNTSYLTAVANDYSYEEVYARILKAKGRKGDILFGISTSGNSENIIKAFNVAKEIGVTTIAMTGQSGGAMRLLSDYLINVPSSDTPRIQEAHIVIGHIICELVEANLM